MRILFVLLLMIFVGNMDGFAIKKSSSKKSKMQRVDIDSIPDSQMIFYKTNDMKPIELPDSVYDGRKVLHNSYFTFEHSYIIVFDGEITKIPDGAFMGIENLSEITLPSNVVSIGVDAFCGCDNLRKISLPAGLKTIGVRAFNSCLKLRSITIPDSVENIGVGAFVSCYGLQEFSGKFATIDGKSLISDGKLISIAVNGLKEFTIPTNVKEVDLYSVNWFTNNTDKPFVVYCKPDAPPHTIGADSSHFAGDLQFNTIVYVPAVSLELYQKDPNWSRFKIVGYVY